MKTKKIKMTKRIPKSTGLYLYKNSKEEEIELVYIVSDKDGVWVYDHPKLKASIFVDEPICCYGPVDVEFSDCD